MFLSESLPDVSAQRRVSLPRWPPGGPPEPPGRVTSGGPSLGAAVGAGAAPRAWAASGHTEGAEQEDATRGGGQAGSARRDPDPGARPGWEGRGRGGGGVCSKTLDRGGQGGVAVRVGLFLLLAFMIFFFHGSGKNNLIHPCPLWKNKPLSKATCRSVSTSGTHERKPVSKHLARVSVQ